MPATWLRRNLRCGVRAETFPKMPSHFREVAAFILSTQTVTSWRCGRNNKKTIDALRRRRDRFWFVHRFKPALHLFPCLRNSFWVVDDVQEKTAHVEGRPAKLAKLGRPWWAVRVAGLRNT